MCVSFRETLVARRGQLWNGTAQFLYREGLERSWRNGAALPSIREWNEATRGQEYLQDVHALLLDHPAELEEFCKKFPHIAATGNVKGDAFGREFHLESGQSPIQVPSLQGTPPSP